MAEIQVKISVPVWCECGAPLKQIDKINNTITVKLCSTCAEEIRSEAYNKGLENGRKSKE